MEREQDGAVRWPDGRRAFGVSGRGEVRAGAGQPGGAAACVLWREGGRCVQPGSIRAEPGVREERREWDVGQVLRVGMMLCLGMLRTWVG